MTSDNISVIQKEFTKQAAVFENRWNQRMKRDNKEIMGWVLGQVGQVFKDMRALDVASGTGIFARALAPLCRYLNFELLDELKRWNYLFKIIPSITSLWQ